MFEADGGLILAELEWGLKNEVVEWLSDWIWIQSINQRIYP